MKRDEFVKVAAAEFIAEGLRRGAFERLPDGRVVLASGWIWKPLTPPKG